MPTSQHENEEVGDMYEHLKELMNAKHGKDYMVTMGDWNAVVGEEMDGNEICQFGLGKQNEIEQTLLKLGNKLMAAHT